MSNELSLNALGGVPKLLPTLPLASTVRKDRRPILRRGLAGPFQEQDR
jgi:hypothetical protein